MATDDLIDDGTDGEKAPQTPAPVSSADISKAVSEGLGGLGADLKGLPGQIAQQVGQVLAEAQRADARGNATQTQSDLTQRLLTDPQTAITEVVQKLLADNLGPYLATKVQDDYEGLVERQRAEIDAEYGDGTFDEVILADLENIIDKTPNKASKGQRQYIKTVVEGIMGNKAIRPKLRERLTTKIEADKKREADMDAPNGILDGGRRRGPKPALSAEDTAFLAKYEESTGKSVDRKFLEEAIAVRRRDGGWTEDNFPGMNK